jgi:drug/metabolite transporter (DMT)-like permease
VRVCRAFCTVTGLAWYSATSDRVDGSFAPGAAWAIHFFRCSTIRELLSLFMRNNSSATLLFPPVVSPRSAPGLWWGLVGVAAFSFTVPFTKIAVAGLSPLFIGSGRAVVAAILAAAALALTRQRLPRGVQWGRLALVAGGVVVGFPLLTSFALTTTPASHGAVVIALLPAATATAAVLRGRERPPSAFWLITGMGALAAIGFASMQSGGFGQLHWADVLLLGAVVAAAIGYAEGGLLARELGAWQTVSWALVLASPLMVFLAAVSVAQQPSSATPVQWAAFAYLGVISMFLGFFAWYRGLAIGPMAQVSQIQLVQPVLSICWAGLLLGETLTWTTIVGGLAVILCAGAAVRVRLRPAAAQPAEETATPSLQTVKD